MNISNIFSKQNMGEVYKALAELTTTRKRKYDAMIIPTPQGYLMFDDDYDFCEYLLKMVRNRIKNGQPYNLSHVWLVKKKKK